MVLASRTTAVAQRRKAARATGLTRPAFMTIVMAILALLTFSAFMAPGSSAGGMGVAAATDKRSEYGTVIGIDLGTTYSCVGAQVNGRVEIITNDQGNRITPSYVAFTPERLVGDAAKNQFASNPERTIFDVVSCTSRFVHLQLLTTSAEASHRSEVQGQVRPE